MAGAGDHVGLPIRVDGQDVLGCHGPHPVLDGTRDSAGDVNLRRYPGAGLTDLVAVGTPAVVGNRTRAPDDPTQ